MNIINNKDIPPISSPEMSEDDQDWSQDIEEGSVDADDDVSDNDQDANAT